MPKISDTGSDFLPRVYVAGKEIARGVAKRKYGGEEGAYRRALEIMAELQARYPRPDSPLPRMPFYRQPQTTSKWGWSGISKTRKRGHNGNWEEDVFLVSIRNAEGTRTNAAFYPHLYRSEEECLRAAVVYRVEYELDLLVGYEEDLRAWFGQVGAEPWPELLALINDMRETRLAVLGSGGRPQPRERPAPTPPASGARVDPYRPRTTRLNPSPPLRATDDELGLLPDEDFILSL